MEVSRKHYPTQLFRFWSAETAPIESFISCPTLVLLSQHGKQAHQAHVRKTQGASTGALRTAFDNDRAADT